MKPTVTTDDVAQYFDSVADHYPEINFRDIAQKLIDSQTWQKTTLYSSLSKEPVSGDICDHYSFHRGRTLSLISMKDTDGKFEISHYSCTNQDLTPASRHFKADDSDIFPVSLERVLVEIVFQRTIMFAKEQGHDIDDLSFSIHFQCDGPKKAIEKSVKTGSHLDFVKVR